jgi:hypothetical protein
MENSVSADGKQGLIESFGTSFVYSALEQPYEGVREYVNHVLPFDVLPAVHLVDPPKQAEFGSAEWHAQTLGAGVGMIIPFALLKGTISRSGGALSLGKGALYTAGSTLSKMPVAESFAMGFLYEGIFTPVHDDEHFYEKRIINSVIGGITFGTMAAVSHSLGNTTREMTGIFEKSLAQRTLTGAKNGIVAGVAGGAVNHELHAAANGEDLGNIEGMIQSSYSFAFPGAVMGGLHASNATAKIGRMESEMKEYTAENKAARDADPAIKQLTEKFEKEKFLNADESRKLQALIQFPREPMLASLRVKELDSSIRPTESAILNSHREFPTNKRAQELVTKELGGGITEVEAKELQKFRDDLASFQKRLPRTNRLWKRAEQGDLNVLHVMPGEGKSLNVYAGGADKAIFTEGLDRNTATAIVIPQKSGGKYVALASYKMHGDIDSHIAQVKTLIDKGMVDRDPNQKVSVLIRQKTFEDTTDGIVAERLAPSIISSELQARYGAETLDVKKTLADERMVGQRDLMQLVLRVPADPKKAVEWSSLIDIGKLGQEAAPPKMETGFPTLYR